MAGAVNVAFRGAGWWAAGVASPWGAEEPAGVQRRCSKWLWTQEAPGGRTAGGGWGAGRSPGVPGGPGGCGGRGARSPRQENPSGQRRRGRGPRGNERNARLQELGEAGGAGLPWDPGRRGAHPGVGRGSREGGAPRPESAPGMRAHRWPRAQGRPAVPAVHPNPPRPCWGTSGPAPLGPLSVSGLPAAFPACVLTVPCPGRTGGWGRLGPQREIPC